MADNDKPDTIEDADLDQATGGITLDNGIKFKSKVETSEGGPGGWSEISTMHQSTHKPSKG